MTYNLASRAAFRTAVDGFINDGRLVAVPAPQRAFGKNRYPHAAHDSVRDARHDAVTILPDGWGQSHLHHTDPQAARSDVRISPAREGAGEDHQAANKSEQGIHDRHRLRDEFVMACFNRVPTLFQVRGPPGQVENRIATERGFEFACPASVHLAVWYADALLRIKPFNSQFPRRGG